MDDSRSRINFWTLCRPEQRQGDCAQGEHNFARTAIQLDAISRRKKAMKKRNESIKVDFVSGVKASAERRRSTNPITSSRRVTIAVTSSVSRRLSDSLQLRVDYELLEVQCRITVENPVKIPLETFTR